MPSWRPIVVVINGLDDLESNNNDSTAANSSIQSRAISDLNKDARVRVFDFLDKNAPPPRVDDGYLFRHAQNIIHQLNGSDEGPLGSHKDAAPVVFLAHATGAALVKKILLLALQDPSTQWLAVWTVAVHFVDTPIHYEQSEWEHYVVRLVGDDRMNFWHLSGSLEGLPSALSQVELEFSLISDAFNVHYHNTPESDANANLPNQHAFWGFHDNDAEYLDMLASINRVLDMHLNEEIRKMRHPFWMGFHQRYLAVPEATLGWLIPDRQLCNILGGSFDHDDSDFSAWRESSKSEILLVIGPPGSEAKHLACWAITTLQPKPSAHKADMLILSYDFDCQDVRQNTERSLLASLIQQMIILRPDSCGNIEARLGKISRSNMPYIPCSLLWEMLRTLLQTVRARRVFLIIHAVDQCLTAVPKAHPKEPPQTVARKLADLSLACQQSFARHIKILMTSSESLDLGREIGTRRLDLSSDGCKDIVRKIAKERMSAIISQVPAWRSLEQDILGKICAKEHTHLQTMLNLGILEQSTIPATKEAIQSWLSKPLPFSAASLQLEVRNIPLARNILSWVSYAVRPLTIRELSMAVALQSLALDGVKSGKTSLDTLEAKVSSNLTRDIERAVKVLLNIGDNQHVTLAHHTLRKSLENEGTFLWPNQHASIAGQCLLYMSLCSRHNSEDTTSQPAGAALHNVTALLAYSQRYWTQHYALAQSPNDDLDQQVLDFLTSGSQSPALTSWAKIISGKTQPDEISIDDPLLLAIQLGFGRVVRLILGREDVQQQPDRLDKALIFSAKSLPLTSDIMGDLLPHISSSHDLGPALRTAAAYGNTMCVELLLNRMGGSWDNFLKSVEGQRDQDPLLLAASGGHTSTVELLVKRGCSILRKDGHENTPLHLAAQLGDADTLLAMRELQKDDFNLGKHLKSKVPYENLNPLGLACRIGSLSVFDILFINDSDEEQLPLSYSPADGSPVYNRSAVDILKYIASNGNLAMARKLSTWSRNSLSHFFDYCSCDFSGRIASTEVIKFFVEEEELSIEREASAADQHQRREEFDKNIGEWVESACRRKHNELSLWLLEKVKKPMWDKYIETAADSGNLPLLRFFLNHVPPVSDSLRTKDGVTTWVHRLDIAVRWDYVDVVRYLVNIIKRARNSVSQHLEPKKPELASMLVRAADFGRTFLLRELFRDLFIPFNLSGAWGLVLEQSIDRGTLANLNEVFKWKPEGYKPSTSTGKRTLDKAVNMQDDAQRLERVRLLLTHGILASILAGKDSSSAIYVAVVVEHFKTLKKSCDIKVVELLLEAGASPNVDGNVFDWNTPLHIALENGRADIVRLLLHHGGDPNLFDRLGQNVLHMAIRKQSTDMVSLLLDPWIQNIRYEEDPNRSTSLRRRSSWNRHGAPHPTRDLPITENLKRPFVDAKMSDEHGKTPLILAVESGLNDVTRMLLLAGADPNLHDSNMCTPLNAAIWTGSFELVKTLIDHNADVNITASHPFGSPLHFLVRMRPDEEYFSQTADLLLQNKANVNAQDPSGFTPLMRYLCQYQAPSIPSPSALPSVLARFIEETSPPLTNCLGKTALHYAAFYPGTLDVIKMLLEARANPLARDNLGHTPLYYSLLSVERDLMRNSTAWSDRVQTFMDAIPAEDRQHALSEAILAAVKTGLEVRLDMVLNEKEEEGLNLLLDIPDNSGYQALDIAYSFGKEYETAAQKIIALGGKTGSDDKKKSPTRWNKDDSSEHLHVSEDGMEVSFMPYPMASRFIMGGVRADHPIPTHRRRFYFEVEVVELRLPVDRFRYQSEYAGAVAIGFQTEQCTLRSCAGWERGSWGYHSDDGKVYNFSEPIYTYPGGRHGLHPLYYSTTNVIGVFVDPPRQRARFRTDDEWVGDWFYGVVGQLYPAVSFYIRSDCTAKLKVNFGKGGNGKTGGFKYPPKKEDWEDGTPEAEEHQEEKEKEEEDDEKEKEEDGDEEEGDYDEEEEDEEEEEDDEEEGEEDDEENDIESD